MFYVCQWQNLVTFFRKPPFQLGIFTIPMEMAQLVRPEWTNYRRYSVNTYNKPHTDETRLVSTWNSGTSSGGTGSSGTNDGGHSTSSSGTSGSGHSTFSSWKFHFVALSV